MTDEKRGVEVWGAGTDNPDRYENANGIDVKADGHLMVTSGDDNVAIYVPGHWGMPRTPGRSPSPDSSTPRPRPPE